MKGHVLQSDFPGPSRASHVIKCWISTSSSSLLAETEDLEYIRGLRHLWSLGLHQHSPEIEVLNCLHPFPQAFHSLKLNWTMGVVPRLMGNTSLIHHLEVITCDQDPLNVFESEDFPCLHTISHPTAFLSCIRCQGMSETGNVSRPSAHGTLTDLRNGRSRGWIPAECLEQKMLYAYATVCTQGDFTLSRK